jgi:hypothetical protein
MIPSCGQNGPPVAIDIRFKSSRLVHECRRRQVCCPRGRQVVI